jgi:poly(hydroxyalkanoate) depolymerase family esterase
MKIWQSHLQRLMAFQGDPAPRPAAKSDAPVSGILAEAAGTPPLRESRVRPRAAAWASGNWVRASHCTPTVPGRLANPLSYGLYLPVRAAHAEALPLVVLLHGCKQSVDEFAAGTRMNLLADKFGFAVAYPEQSKHNHAHRCWHWYDDREHAGRGEALAVLSLIDALAAQHGLDTERVYLAGLSAGAGLAALLALHYPERFAAVALHSGPVLGAAYSGTTAMDVMRRASHHDPLSLLEPVSDVAAYPGMPAVIIHGDTDRVVAPKNADQLALQFARLNGLVDAEGACAAGELRESRQDGFLLRDYLKGGKPWVGLCRVGGLGHAWAGGDDAVPFHSSKGPNASALIWDFFHQHRRPLTNGMNQGPLAPDASPLETGTSRAR